MSNKPKKPKKLKKSKKPGVAATMDALDLYERSVQNPEADVEFLDAIFNDVKGRKARSLREDFCGTGAMCAAWVKGKNKRTAVGLDLCDDTLAWGIQRNIKPLGDEAERVKLLKKDVLTGTKEKSDLIVAFNFSYCIFKERKVLLDYFKKVREGLNEDGAFFVDCHGGTDLGEKMKERKKFDGFTYVWDQRPMCAITNQAIRHIHFEFDDGSKLKKAFTYDWRMWSLPELKDLMVEAGFSKVDIFWEGATEDGEGDGDFIPMDTAEEEQSWIAYVGAWR
ncbi:MAG: class I SAM-dependent methyltransferase [Deltaproteobacteria bacterium]|jgi:cyclopropane fatty-acyl-phospholipid synthase-like methyltransferase|nr:class I SAM-dependent methyltransferase [Deltaproteobacteria bacterium]MBT6492499.1 class I SAM-dependent methyltransferase [Deltaproteobacteria bacterium]